MTFINRLLNSLVKRTKVVQTLQDDITTLTHALNHPDRIVSLNSGVKVYVPALLEDYIQRILVCTNTFYEADLLATLDEYIPDHATILDIGSNIGNHSLYWATKRSAEKIYAFEPVRATFDILQKNIEINELDDVIRAANVGLTDKTTKANIARFDPKNIGGTRLSEDESGELELISIDSLALEETQIHLMKIDTEGFEKEVLLGSKKTIEQYKPLIFIEVFKHNATAVERILNDYGYTKLRTFKDDNYLYAPAA